MIYLNGQEVQFTQFPDGQWHCNIKERGVPYGGNLIHARLANFEDVGKLLLLADCLQDGKSPIRVLCVTYLVGSRMDRRLEVGEPHTLKVVAKMLSTVKPEAWQFVEPHSDVLEALIQEPFRITGWEIMLSEHAKKDEELLKRLTDSTLITPDAGMHKKISRFCNRFKNFNVVEASKTRNLETGEITDTKIYGSVGGKDCLVVDDICDGGRTFIELAKVLKSEGAAKLYLAVCHGVFSNDATAHLLEYYDYIYATNSYRDLREVVIKNPGRITVIDLFKDL